MVEKMTPEELREKAIQAVEDFKGTWGAFEEGAVDSFLALVRQQVEAVKSENVHDTACPPLVEYGRMKGYNAACEDILKALGGK